jgi:hypothetical protein
LPVDVVPIEAFRLEEVEVLPMILFLIILFVLPALIPVILAPIVVRLLAAVIDPIMLFSILMLPVPLEVEVIIP